MLKNCQSRASLTAMPKTDTSQDGNALDTMGEMDSTGSCDSVVSFNSCFSDDSLGFLSAEEKACLMFLEETIQSLDTEDDSGLSTDESELIPPRGNVATKAAHLSASIRLSQLAGQDMPRRHNERPLSSGSPEKNEVQNYMVPTPFILANCNSQIPNRSGLAPSRTKKTSNMKMSSGNAQLCQEAPQVPSEVSVVGITPPQKIKSKDTVEENLSNQKPQNVPGRGPLTYEDLVQLRMTASVRRDQAAEATPKEHQVPANKNVHLSNNRSPPGIQTLGQISTARKSTGSKPPPPPVAPKPKVTALLQAPMNQEGPTNLKSDTNLPHSGLLTVDELMNPEKVRLEALCKLGLLKSQPSNTRQLRTKEQDLISQQLRHQQSPLHNQTTGESLPPCVAPKPGKIIKPPVQTHIVHHQSMSDLCTDPSCLQHNNMTSASTMNQNHQSCSSTAETRDRLRDIQMDAGESRLKKGQEPEQMSSRSKSQHVQGLTVPVHSIGKDRREALRKLGLLKN